MQKHELEEIANISDLKKYRESKEYKNILEDCKNAEEKSREKVRQMFHEETEKEFKWDFHDKTNSWVNFLRDKLEGIKSTGKGAEALKKELVGDITFNDNMMTGHVMDKYNNVYSQVMLNNYDMERLKGTHNRIFPQILDGLITMLEKTEQKEEEIY